MNLKLNLTEGNIYKTMMAFAIPFLLTNLLQALYGAVDVFVVGQYCDAAGISAVSTGSQVMQTILCLITGLTTGGTVVVGQLCGARDEDGIKTAISTMFRLYLCLAVVMTVVFVLLSKQMTSWVHAPKEAFDETRQYIFICSFGILFSFLYNCIAATLRGFGDSKSPLIFVLISCLCNIALDIFMVGVLQWGAPGAAVATVMSQGICIVVAIIWCKRKSTLFELVFSRKSIDGNSAKRLVKMGLPIAMQDSLVMISFLVITAIVNKMGVNESAALGISERINSFTLLPPSAFSAAIATAVAQNVGAGLTVRAKKCLWIGVGFSLIFGVACFLYLEIFPQHILGLFTNEAKVILGGTHYLRGFSIDCVLVCFVFCMGGYFNGHGETAYTMKNNLAATFIVRIPAVFLLSTIEWNTMFWIGLAAPLASLFSVIWFIVSYRRKMKILP